MATHDPETAVRRYAITHISRYGDRVITGPNQGHRFFTNKKAAAKALTAFKKNNADSTLTQVFGAQALGTFEIRPIQCWPHGDAKGCYPDE